MACKEEMMAIEWNEEFNKIKDVLELDKYVGRRHLDFGCGYGYFAKLLSEKYNRKVLGFDIDRDKIEMGKERYGVNENYTLSSHLDSKYDSVTAIRVLHEVPDIDKTLKLIYEHLNKGGRILIYDFRKISKEEFRKIHESWPHKRSFEEEYEEHNKWSLDEFKKMMEKVGFKTIKAKEVGKCELVYIGEKV